METTANEIFFAPGWLLELSLSLQKDAITREMDVFREYIEDNRENIKKAREQFMQMVNREFEKYPDHAVDIQEHYESSYYQYTEFYPAVFNNSTLLSLYSFFEYNLKQLCQTIASNINLKIKLKDLSGQNYIEKSKKYLRLVVEIDLEDLEPIWKQLTIYQKLRNKIVHNNSSIIENSTNLKSQPLYTVVTSNPYLKLNESNGTFIISDDRFLLRFCDIIEQYLLPIIQRVKTAFSKP